MSLKKHKLALAIAAAAGMTFSAGAMATNGIMQAGNGMVAHGLGGAGISNATEAMAGYDNPALISQTGDSLSLGFSVFMPDRAIEFAGGGEAASDNNVFAIPQIAFTSKLSDQMSWGIMVNAMGGMNTDYRFGQSVDLSGMMIAPTMSFALSKDLSLGASLLLGYENFRVRDLFGMGVSDEGSGMMYGVKLGADWKVTDGISLGATLQPKMSGEEFSFFTDFLGLMGFNGDAALVLPNTVGVGGKFAVGKNVDIVADVMYYQWTSVDVFEFFGWDDQTVVKVGAEFRPSEKLALRAGVNWGESPIKGGTIIQTSMGPQDAADANYLFPAISETHITLGLGYQMDKNMAVNAYYLYSPENKETSSLSGDSIVMSQNAFGLGINYQTK